MGLDSPIDRYALPAAATIAGMHQLFRFTKCVGKARGEYNVQVPAVDGPPEFVRVFRAHQNTLEFYPPTLVSLWLGSIFFDPVPASLLYAGYLVGREKYFRGYVESTEKRIPGFKVSMKFLYGLLVISALGVGHKFIRYYGNVDIAQVIVDKVHSMRGA